MKLTPPQRKLLREIVDSHNRVTCVPHFAPAVALVALGLARFEERKLGNPQLRPTPAGIEYMEAANDLQALSRAAAEVELLAERADPQRIIDWLCAPEYKPPDLAFTAGPERRIADAFVEFNRRCDSDLETELSMHKAEVSRLREQHTALKAEIARLRAAICFYTGEAGNG